jgi:hypothetical protein
MRTADKSMTEQFLEMRKVAVEASKRRHHSQRQALKERQATTDLARGHTKPPPEVNKIAIYKRNDQWVATAGQHVIIDNDPESAMRRLLVRMCFAAQSHDEISKRMRLYRSMPINDLACPSCSVLDMNTKADLDGEYRYVVDFTTNIRLCRGDVEGLFCAMMKSTMWDGLSAFVNYDPETNDQNAKP